MNNRSLKETIEREKRNYLMFNTLCALGVVLLVVLQYCDAYGQDLTALHLAQCLRAECDSCYKYPKEKATLAWILQKGADRTNRSLDEQILAYCALYKNVDMRAVSILASTFGYPRHGTITWWSEMDRWTSLFLSGKIKDPHPEAFHWGGNIPHDINRAKKAGWILVAKYSNLIWRLP